MTRRRPGIHPAPGSARIAHWAPLLAIMSLACRGDLRDQILIDEPPNNPPAQSGGASPLIGSWDAVDSTVTVDSTTADSVSQTVTTVWAFNSDGSCSVQTTTVITAASGSQTASRTCTYIDRGVSVTVAFDDGTSEDLPYSISADELILGGVTYHKSG